MSRIVWFHPRQPVPPRGGGDFRTLGLVRGALSAGHEVLFVHPDEELPSGADDPLPGRLRSHGIPLRQGLSGAAAKVLSRSPLRAPRPTRAGLRAARAAIEAFDPQVGIASEGMIWGTVAALMPDVPWIYDAHNVEHELFAGHLAHASSTFDRVTFRLDRRRIAREERLLLARADLTLVVSPEDRAGLARLVPDADYVLVPSSMTAPTTPADPGAAGPVVLFVGTLDFPPNEEAVELLVREVMPQVVERRPDARLLVVGRRPTTRVREALAAAPWIDFWEDAPDIAAAYAQARCVVMPFRSGSGTKLKMYEAFANGMPVVATPKGAAGVDLRPGTDLVVAEELSGLVDGLASFLDDPELARSFGRVARAAFDQRLSWERAAYPGLLASVDRLVDGGRG